MICGAGWQPAADCKSAIRSITRIIESIGRPIFNRPQVANLPHITSNEILQICSQIPDGCSNTA